VDNSDLWSQEEENIFQSLKNKNYLLIINKIDQENKLQLPNYISSKEVVKISAKNQQLTELEIKINELFAGNLINNLSPYPYLSQS